MSRRLLIVGILMLTAISFLAGVWISNRSAGRGSTAGGRKILHYVDPMHPSYTSEKPGTAPDCGMELVPVYADGSGPAAGGKPPSLLPGTVQVSSDRQQLIGVKTVTVASTGGSHTLRLLGRVTPDELRTYVINATIDGWITDVRPNTTGSLVRKNEVLATFYSPEFLSAVQALLFALNSMDRVQAQPAAANLAQQGQIDQFGINLKQYRMSLHNLGMGEPQIEEMIRTRQFMETVDIIAPGDGFILTRSVSPGQRFDKGKELYRIADLSKVWILVDTFGSEAEQLKPGTVLKVTSATSNRTHSARVANILPQFDPVSRTLKVRLEVDNPGYHLRPDMFVDVEVPVQLASGVVVPYDAVLDSGLKKTVFVDRGNGFFEPRRVETGRSLGDRVEIVRGLMAGEKIVVSGNFLLDSESRMRQAAAGITGKVSRDPVCGMDLDEERSRAAGYLREYQGKGYTFCSVECRDTFSREPRRYTASPAPAGEMPLSGPADTKASAKPSAPSERKPIAEGEHKEHHSTPGMQKHD